MWQQKNKHKKAGTCAVYVAGISGVMYPQQNWISTKSSKNLVSWVEEEEFGHSVF